MIFMFFISIIHVFKNVEFLYRDNQWFMLAYYDFFGWIFIWLGFQKVKYWYIFLSLLFDMLWNIIFWKKNYLFQKYGRVVFYIACRCHRDVFANFFCKFFLNSKIDLISVESIHYIQLNNIKFQYVEFIKIVTHSSCHEG
jgi:hypothetical protein